MTNTTSNETATYCNPECLAPEYVLLFFFSDEVGLFVFV